ncbi:hypothetical protein DFQ30_001292, partial [Apophysomyces sp. BC1015]
MAHAVDQDFSYRPNYILVCGPVLPAPPLRESGDGDGARRAATVAGDGAQAASLHELYRRAGARMRTMAVAGRGHRARAGLDACEAGRCRAARRLSCDLR